MGRLFWKFFFFVWLAQLTTVLGVTAFYWWERGRDAERWQQRAPVFAEPRLPGPPPVGERLPRPLPPGGPGGPDGGPEMLGGPPSPGLPLAPLTAGFFASLVFAALLARYFSRPIRTLRSAFAEVAAGHLDRRTADQMEARRDELTDLGRDFDNMAERLQQLIDGQRRLLHDVSHELRSPLARLQAAIDLTRQQPGRQAELQERIERESRRMDRLVGELLTLSRLETGMRMPHGEAIDVAELLAGIVADARFEARARGIDVVLREQPGTQGVCVAGDGELLQRAIENVVRNALKYSPDGRTVDVALALQAGAGQLAIAVEDAGPGVAEGDLAAIFEPFNRGGRPPDDAGHGLGLAIARRVIEGMDGTIACRNRPGGGLRVEIRLPMAGGRRR